MKAKFENAKRLFSKWFIFFIGWFIPIYLIPCFNNLIASEFLIWYYTDMHLPPLSWKMFLLMWIVMMVMTGIILSLAMDGVSKKQNLGKLYPLSVVIVNQIAAGVTYMLIAEITDYKGLLYYPGVFLSFVINEIDSDIINSVNESTWLFWLTLISMIILLAAGMLSYFQQRNRQARLIEIEKNYLKEKYNKL
ncbi:MAG: hypothetical protein IKL36_00570 [Clostridia bacterium]|nr:hypothetical protein [Clostridia bacterium]